MVEVFAQGVVDRILDGPPGTNLTSPSVKSIHSPLASSAPR